MQARTIPCPTIDIFYASHDGQTRLIVGRLASRLAGPDREVSTHDLAIEEPAPSLVGRADVTVLAAPIRYGFPLPAADRFLRRHGDRIDPGRFAVLLVCLTARKPGRQSVEGNGYLRGWLRRRRCSPAIAAAIGGRLNYPAYTWYDRLMIRLIMTISGGPTDPSMVVEYTDWQQVERLAEAVAALVDR